MCCRPDRADAPEPVLFRKELIENYIRDIRILSSKYAFADIALVNEGDIERVAALVADMEGQHPFFTNDLMRGVSNARVTNPQYFRSASTAFAAADQDT